MDDATQVNQTPAPELGVGDLDLLGTIVEGGKASYDEKANSRFATPRDKELYDSSGHTRLLEALAAAKEAGAIENLSDDECYRLTQILIQENSRLADSLRHLATREDTETHRRLREAGEKRKAEILVLVTKLARRRDELAKGAAAK